MKLVIATPLYPPDIGGPATYARALEEGLPGRGIEVETVKFSAVRHLPNAVRQIAYCGKMFSRAPRADMILALDPVSVGWPAFFANLFLRKKFVVKIVGDHVWEQGKQRFGIAGPLDGFPAFSWRWHPYLWFLRALQFRVAQGADRIIVPSEYLKRIVSTWGVPPERIEVIYNAVPVEEPGAVPDAAARLPRPLVVTAGRLVPWKHIDGIIDAVADLRPYGGLTSIKASLAIVGDGPDRAALLRRAGDRLGARAALTGRLSHADTLAVMKSADVFVLNSSYEGLSHLLIEAQELGAPTIATRVGGNVEVVTDNENGLLVPAGDTSGLAAALARLLGDAALRSRLAARGRELAARFSNERMVSATAAFLTKLA